MKISWDKLHHLPVFTKSGDKLGVVEGVTIDVDSHAVTVYEVAPNSVILAFLSKNLLISPSEVLSITLEKMTVKDACLPEKAGIKNKAKMAFASQKAGINIQEMPE